MGKEAEVEPGDGVGATAGPGGMLGERSLLTKPSFARKCAQRSLRIEYLRGFAAKSAEEEVPPLTRRKALFAGTVGSLLTHGYRDGGATRRGSALRELQARAARFFRFFLKDMRRG